MEGFECEFWARVEGRTDAKEPYALDVGEFARTVSIPNKSVDALAWWNRGMVWAMGFHHEEAIVCFERCLNLEPRCAMAHFGIAFCHGPNYNFHRGNGYYSLSAQTTGFPSQREAYAAAQRALALVREGGDDVASPVEAALIEALAIRYVWPECRFAPLLSEAFAGAMREVQREFPEDLEVRCILAESLMDLRPWDLWTETGELRPGSGEIKDLIEAGLTQAPEHPWLCHLYVHLMELSPTPEKALRACAVLRDATPDVGHLLHMPSHIDVLVGDYSAAVTANEKAVAADVKAVETGHSGAFYVGYICHDYHMLVYAAMFAGREAAALRFSRDMRMHLTPELLSIPQAAFGLEAYYATEIHVLLRFGRWQAILDYPEPEDPKVYCTTMATLIYARGVAFGVLGNVDDALAAQQRFEALRADPGVQNRLLHNNPVPAILAVGSAMLEGELQYRQGRFDEAFDALRRGVQLDDQLVYDEPWGWMQPVRHALGALLVQQERFTEAAEVYKADMSPGRHPLNPWALCGLLACYRAIPECEEAEVATTAEQLATAVREAQPDIEFEASCACALVAAPPLSPSPCAACK